MRGHGHIVSVIEMSKFATGPIDDAGPTPIVILPPPPIDIDPQIGPTPPIKVPGPVKPPLSPKDTTGSQWYVTGMVYDAKTQNSIPVYIQLVVIATGKPLLANQAPYLVANGDYAAWTDQNPSEIGVEFTAKGYKKQVISFLKLDSNPNVYLQPGSEIPVWAILLVASAVIIYQKRTDKKVSGIDSGTVVGIFLIIGGILGFGLIQKILNMLGLGGDPTGGEAANPNSCWKPTYWQNFTSYTYALTEDQARAYGSTIYNAFTLFNDDYDAIKSVFNSLRTKANVSFLAWEFQKQYNTDLLSFLTDGGGILPWDGLSHSHLATIISLVNSLPAH